MRLLAPHLTPENHTALLASARHKTKREVGGLVAALAPKPDTPTVVRKLPVRPGATMPPCAPEPGPLPAEPAAAALAVPAEVRYEVPATPTAPVRVATLGPDRYRIQVTVSQVTHDKFRRVQALLRHAVPSGDAAEIFDRALTLLVDYLERRRCAETPRPKMGKAPVRRSRHVPAAVRREVWTDVARESRASDRADR